VLGGVSGAAWPLSLRQFFFRVAWQEATRPNATRQNNPQTRKQKRIRFGFSVCEELGKSGFYIEGNGPSNPWAETVKEKFAYTFVFAPQWVTLSG